MSEGPVLRARELVKRFGGLTAVDRVSLEVGGGEIHALIGPNGAGKTTLVNLIAGELPPDHGRVWLSGREITRLKVAQRAWLGLARSFQISSLFGSLTALEHVALALQGRWQSSFRFWRDVARDRSLLGRAREGLLRVGLEDAADVPAEALSHGQRRQLELAMALAMDPVLLLLDEPLAGIGVEEGERMVELLAGLRGRVAVLLVEHDMDAVFRLADRITVLSYGRVIASGPPGFIRDHPEVVRAYLGEAEVIDAAP